MKCFLRPGDVSLDPEVRYILMEFKLQGRMSPDSALLKMAKGYHMVSRQMAKWSLIGFL